MLPPLLPLPVPVAPELDAPDGAARRSLLLVAPGEPAASLRRFTEGTLPSRLMPLGPLLVDAACPAPWSERSFGVVGLTCAMAPPASSMDESNMAMDGLCIRISFGTGKRVAAQRRASRMQVRRAMPMEFKQ